MQIIKNIRFMSKCGYHIEKEKIVYENGTYYFVMSFLKGQQSYSLSEYEWGYKIKEDPLFEQFRKDELETLRLNLLRYRSSTRANEEAIKEHKYFTNTSGEISI